MQFELKRMHRELRKTFIYVTHDQEEAMAMSDRIVVMKDAKILQVDTPEALYYEPTSTAVARFVGAANVVTGRVVRSDASETWSQLRTGSSRRRAARPRGRPAKK